MRSLALSAVVGTILALAAMPMPASATTTVWKTISTGTSETFVDGVTATASFSNGAEKTSNYQSGGTTAPNLWYRTTTTTDSSLTISFSSSNGSWNGVSDLRLFYGWVNLGDEAIVTTNVASSGIDFTDSSVATSISDYLCSGDCAGTGTLTSGGKIADGMVSGSRYNGEVRLHFATPITSITVSSMNGRTIPGYNGFGFQIPVEVPTATFHGNGSTSGSMDPYYSEDTHALPSNSYSRDGYTFGGWNSASDGNGADSFGDGDDYDFSADIELYAQWDADSNDITYEESDAGTPHSGGDDSYLTDGSFTLPTPPTRDGYRFTGWQLSGAHVTTQTLDPAATTASPDGYGPITLTALWEVDSSGESGGSGDGTRDTTLAQTGFDSVPPAAAAVVLVAAGMFLRRRMTR